MQNGQTEPKWRFIAILGCPKAYEGTPRGEVCSYHKTKIQCKIRDITNFTTTFHLLFAYCFIIKLCINKNLFCEVCAFCYSPFFYLISITVYPAFSIAVFICSFDTLSSQVTQAFFSSKLTVALTPLISFSTFSTLPLQ